MTRARNLANLGNKNAITADIGLFNIGIGSTQPTNYKLEVVGGNAYVGGGVTITGNLSVGGTITYEDVTNVDAVGVITAAKGFRATAGGVVVTAGVSTFPVVAVSAGTTTKDLLVTGVSTFAAVSATTGSFSGDVSIADKIVHTGDTNTAIRFPAADTVSVETSGSESFRVDSSQRLLKGLTTARGNYGNNTSGVEYGLQVEGLNALNSTIALVRNSDDANDGGIVLGKTRATSVGGNTVVQASDDLGSITWAGSDGTTLQFGAEITAQVESGVGNDDMPASLIFKTNGGTTSTSERLRIASDGHVAIGGYGDPNSILDVREDKDGAETMIRLWNTDNGDTTTQTAAFYMSPDSRGNATTGLRALKENTSFATNAGRDISLSLNVTKNNSQVEGLRITSAGKVGVNTSANLAAGLMSLYSANEGEGTATGQLELKDNAAYNATPTGGIIFSGHHTAGSQAIFSGIRGFKANTSDGDYDGCLAFDVRTHGAVAYEAMRIDEFGKIGIGTNNPSQLLSLHSTFTHIKLYSRLCIIWSA